MPCVRASAAWRRLYHKHLAGTERPFERAGEMDAAAHLVAVHAGDIERLDVEGVGARARAHEALAQHLVLIVAVIVVVVVRAPVAAGARGGHRGVCSAATVVGALDLVVLAGAARDHPAHLRRLRLPQPPPAAPGLHPDRGGFGTGARACRDSAAATGSGGDALGEAWVWRGGKGKKGNGDCRGETELQFAGCNCGNWDTGIQLHSNFFFLCARNLFLLYLKYRIRFF